jgi:tRNA 2-selenouridine synthase
MDFKLIFKNDVPLIDVRAPIEFGAGSFPCSVNFPIMNDEDRHLVGTRYKEQGQEAAIQLGHERVCGKIKAERVNAWLKFKHKNPLAMLYCFRGGLRSRTAQQWIKESGTEIEIIPGGYKALRRYLIDVIESESKNRKLIVMAGRTGSGKTSVLKKMGNHFLDLEKYAHHKGSSFGILGTQPTQINFENQIAVDLIKQDVNSFTVVESESIMIGSVLIPRVWFNKMYSSPMIVLERSMEDRVSHIIQEYVIEEKKTLSFMLDALSRIKKKLGGLHYEMIRKQMLAAYDSPDSHTGESHRTWVESLLVHYYDQFYDRALKKNESLIVFRGNEEECLQYLRSQK